MMLPTIPPGAANTKPFGPGNPTETPAESNKSVQDAMNRLLLKCCRFPPLSTFYIWLVLDSRPISKNFDT
jgi:hypothetical protein